MAATRQPKPPAAKENPVQENDIKETEVKKERPAMDDEETIVVEEKENERYEEAKKGELHISELQKLTMAQLLATAKKEGLIEYTGLKKQDLIFMILKNRVKANGLMYG